MKIFLTLIVLAASFWCSPVFAEYCTVKVESYTPTCEFRTNLTSKDAQVVVSHSEQGWTLTLTVLLKEFAFVGGDSTVETKRGDVYDLKYVSTSRDLVPARRRWKESAVFLVSESVLHELGSADGKLTFMLAAEEPLKMKVKFGSGTFKDIDAFIAETKTVFADQFQTE